MIVVVPVVEHELEMPVRGLMGKLIGVGHPFQIPLGEFCRVQPIFFPDRARDPLPVLSLVVEPDDVSLIVPHLLKEPLENPARINGIREASVRRPPVEGGHVVLANGSPMDVARPPVGPPFDAGEKPFETRPVPSDKIDARPFDHLPRILDPQVPHPLERRDKILRPGEQKRIPIVGVPVTGQTFVGFARDGRKRKGPTEAKGSIARPGIILEGQGR